MLEENDPTSQATKHGYKTTELVAAITAIGALLQLNPPIHITIGVAVVACVYMICRTIDKAIAKRCAVDVTKKEGA